MASNAARDLFEEKIFKESGLTKIELQCWVRIKEELNQSEYNRIISKFTKEIKNTIYSLKEANGDDYEYFVDVNIRDSPSTTAFLSLQISLIKKGAILNLKNYTPKLKSAVQSYKHFEIFENIKKRKK